MVRIHTRGRVSNSTNGMDFFLMQFAVFVTDMDMFCKRFIFFTLYILLPLLYILCLFNSLGKLVNFWQVFLCGNADFANAAETFLSHCCFIVCSAKLMSNKCLKGKNATRTFCLSKTIVPNHFIDDHIFLL